MRRSKLSLSEVITIQVLFPISGYRNFKKFHLDYVCKFLTKDFPSLMSYNKRVALKASSFMPMAIYLKTQSLGACTGVSFIDSTPLRVYDNRRIH